jgi:hypothetical protein
MDERVKATVIKSIPFCADDSQWAGSLEVVKIHARNTIGIRLRVGKHCVHIARHRVAEIIAALEIASNEASKCYIQLLKEMNS